MGNKTKRLLILVSLFTFLPNLHAQYSKLPESARRMLDEMPGRVLTPEYVVGVGMKNSSSFKRILSNYPATEIPVLQQEASLDWYLDGQALYLENFKEQSTTSVPTFPYTTQYDLGLSKAFSTGTSASVGLTLSEQRLKFALMPEFKYKESTLKFELAQSLWKNFLGNGTRNSLTAAYLEKDAAELAILSEAEQWVLGLVGLYFEAWIAQKTAQSALDNLERKKILLNSTLAKYKRGTAEKPEKLQIESGVESARADYLQKKQILHNNWHALVVSLGLPRDLLTIDPALIPMSMPTAIDDSICQNFQIPTKTIAAQKAELEAKAARLNREAAKSNSGPEVSAFTKLNSNGIEDNFSSAFSESSHFENLEWGLGIKFSVPLGFKADKAAIRASIVKEKVSEAIATGEREQVEIDYRNTCEEVETLRQTKKFLTETVKNQKLRAKLEQERFDLGRTSMFNVIQASDDAAMAELTLQQIESKIQIAHWTLEKLSGELSTNIQKQLESYK